MKLFYDICINFIVFSFIIHYSDVSCNHGLFKDSISFCVRTDNIFINTSYRDSISRFNMVDQIRLYYNFNTSWKCSCWSIFWHLLQLYSLKILKDTKTVFEFQWIVFIVFRWETSTQSNLFIFRQIVLIIVTTNHTHIPDFIVMYRFHHLWLDNGNSCNHTFTIKKLINSISH